MTALTQRQTGENIGILLGRCNIGIWLGGEKLSLPPDREELWRGSLFQLFDPDLPRNPEFGRNETPQRSH